MKKAGQVIMWLLMVPLLIGFNVLLFLFEFLTFTFNAPTDAWDIINEATNDT